MGEAVVRELALLGPARSAEETGAVLALASKAAGGQLPDGIVSLQAAAREWLYRSSCALDSVRALQAAAARGCVLDAGKTLLDCICSLQVAADRLRMTDTEKTLLDCICSLQVAADRLCMTDTEKTQVLDAAAAFEQDACTVAGCSVSLAELRRMRMAQQPAFWVSFEKGVVCRTGGRSRKMTVDQFVTDLDPGSTHVLSAVLAARLLWPQEHAKISQFVNFKFDESQACGLGQADNFTKTWSLPTHGTKKFKECVLEQLLIEQNPFLRDVIPSLMQGRRVARFHLNHDVLSFWLDAEDLKGSLVEYRLSFCTGSITSSLKKGVVCELFGLRPFFSRDYDVSLLADLLVELGITDKIRFDRDDAEWRIFDDECGIWRYSDSRHQVAGTVASFILKELIPLRELEFFFGRELEWRRIAPQRNNETACSPAVGSKRPRWSATAAYNTCSWSRTKLSTVLRRYIKKTWHRTQLINTLQQKVLFSFSSVQKPYLLCCRNGLVDLRTGELLRRPLPDDFATEMCPTEYDPEADVAPAAAFFKQYFPADAYPDQAGIVCFLQQFLGYCLTMETSLQLALVLYGSGSNGKNVLQRVVHTVFGEQLCQTAPIGRLATAKHARLLTLSGSSTGSAKLDAADFKTLACGEMTTSGDAHRKETMFRPHAKLLFTVNSLPEFTGKHYSIDRCVAPLELKKIFVDESNRSTGVPESLIQQKDPLYYEAHLEGNERSFLRFWVQGAVAYYANKKDIRVPPAMSMSLHQRKGTDASGQQVLVNEFVADRLYPSLGEKTLVSKLYNTFKQWSIGDEVGWQDYSLSVFGTHLGHAIKQRQLQQQSQLPSGESQAPRWEAVNKKQMRIGGEKGMGWRNLGLSS